MIWQENGSMNVNFEYYKIFYYVAKYGNLTKAAHALSNSQPNITRAMNCLEHELNCTLFIRTNRGVCLTQEGKKLYGRVSVAMAQLQMAEEELADNAELKRGNVSLSVSDIALNIYLLERLKTFHMTYPGVRLKISNHSSEQAVRSVRSGETDFAVITGQSGVSFKRDPSQKISGDTGRRTEFCVSCGQTAFNQTYGGIPLYLSRERNCDFTFLSADIFVSWCRICPGYGGCDCRSGIVSCKK